MGNFYGTFERLLDEKLRLQLPTRLVKPAPERLYIVEGFEGCLEIYTEEGVEEKISSLSKLDYLIEANRHYIRSVSSSVYEAEVDAHGRIQIPKEVASSHSIGREVTLIGVIDHFEVWDSAKYRSYRGQSRLEMLAEKVCRGEK